MGSLKLEPGEFIAERYRLDEPLGEGGIGVVWRGWQLGVERPVAVKFLKASHDADLQQRFDLEARALGRLNHPNCVTVHDFGFSEERGAFFLVMEYLEGQPLSDWRGRLNPLGDIVEVARQIVTGLAYAHHQGIIHRDLKPENIFLADSFGGDRLVKVLDFGLAKLTDDVKLTKAGEVFGTPHYMSPEQVVGTSDVTASTDLYSLGVMLYELIEGRPPFDGDTPMAVAKSHLDDPAPEVRRASVPDSLVEIVARLLAKKPEERYPDALELYDALEAVEFEAAETTTVSLVMVESPRESLAKMPDSFAETQTFDGSPEPTNPDLPPADITIPDAEPAEPFSKTAVQQVSATRIDNPPVDSAPTLEGRTTEPGHVAAEETDAEVVPVQMRATRRDPDPTDEIGDQDVRRTTPRALVGVVVAVLVAVGAIVAGLAAPGDDETEKTTTPPAIERATPEEKTAPAADVVADTATRSSIVASRVLDHARKIGGQIETNRANRPRSKPRRATARKPQAKPKPKPKPKRRPTSKKNSASDGVPSKESRRPTFESIGAKSLGNQEDE